MPIGDAVGCAETRTRPAGASMASRAIVADCYAEHFDMTLEEQVRQLVDRKEAAPPGSAEYKLVVRMLQGLRYSYEGAGGLIEDMDPDWGSYCSPP